MFVYFNLHLGSIAMGRSIKRGNQYWHPAGEYILKRAAYEVLRAYDPEQRGFVTVEDLMAEAWLRSFRHGKDETLGKQLLWSKTHMRTAYRELMWEQVYKQTRPTKQVQVNTRLECRKGRWVVRALDLFDLIVTRCTNRQILPIASLAAGYTTEDVAEEIDTTPQNVTALVRKAREVMEFYLY